MKLLNGALLVEFSSKFSNSYGHGFEVDPDYSREMHQNVCGKIIGVSEDKRCLADDAVVICDAEEGDLAYFDYLAVQTAMGIGHSNYSDSFILKQEDGSMQVILNYADVAVMIRDGVMIPRCGQVLCKKTKIDIEFEGFRFTPTYDTVGNSTEWSETIFEVVACGTPYIHQFMSKPRDFKRGAIVHCRKGQDLPIANEGYDDRFQDMVLIEQRFVVYEEVTSLPL